MHLQRRFFRMLNWENTKFSVSCKGVFLMGKIPSKIYMCKHTYENIQIGNRTSAESHGRLRMKNLLRISKATEIWIYLCRCLFY